jgi:N-acetylglucosaminyl-diphospho-decaprenol L-rhamnosyltransferase
MGSNYLADLAVIIVSTNEAHWLRPCLQTVFSRAGGATLDVIVADNESTDSTAELVRSQFPAARVVRCENRGFAHANNRGFMATDARYVLFLNPDTEILKGTFGDLVRALDERPSVGLIGVKQITADGVLFPTIRRFPNALRALGEALWSERWPFHPSWSGERELDLSVYEREVDCDWTSGSFMLGRREALLSGGILDERFFIYGEEPDLCLRMKKAGWKVRHLPLMTILHHAGKAGVNPKMEAQNTYARMQHARKHFGRTHRALYAAALGTRHSVRAVGFRPAAAPRRAANRQAMRVLVRLGSPPFGRPPGQAVAVSEVPRDATLEESHRDAAVASSRS